jgi:hypothetical protein
VPFLGSQTTVTATPEVTLVSAGSHAQTIFLRNAGMTNSVYIGDPTVTAPGGANPGFELIAGATTPMMQLDPEESVGAICAAGLTTRVDVIQSYSA